MTRDEALAWLRATVSATTPPVLLDEELTAILNSARVVDPDGRAPVADGYVDTFDLNYAAADAFEMKADRMLMTATPQVSSFSSEGSSFTMSGGLTVGDLRAMAARYRSRSSVGGTISVIEVDADYRSVPRSAVNLDTSHAHHQ